MALAAIDVLRTERLRDRSSPTQVCCGLPMISNGLYAGRPRPGRGRTSRSSPTTPGAATGSSGRRRRARTRSRPSTARCSTSTTPTPAPSSTRPGTSASCSLDLHEQGRLDTRLRADRRDAALPCAVPAPQPRDRAAGDGAVRACARADGGRPRPRLLRRSPGTYGLKKEKYDIAMAVGAPLFSKVRAATDAAATRAACDSETCRWQIAAATSTHGRSTRSRSSPRPTLPTSRR